MNRLLTAAYHRLPAGARTAVASARGLYLQRWRYGPDSERLVEEALGREGWTPDRWRAWQEERLARLLDRAARRVPAYREQWAERRRAGDRSSWERLEHWPVLTKEALRANPRAYLADDCDPRTMHHEHTSGTTGKPLDLWFSRASVQAWYALFEARWRRWNGVTRYDRWALLGGQLVVPATARRPPFWVWNAGMRQLYMSSYHLAPGLLPHYVEALRHFRVRYIVGYSSSIDALARSMLATGATLPLEVVLTSAEPLLASQRTTIEQAFGCPVRETYGMSEIAAAASECGAGSLHVWPDAGVMECFTPDGPAAGGVTGDLICTGLINDDMPLIRYATGDRGALTPHGDACACGRALPRLQSIEGRSDDVLLTADGRAVGRLDPVFKARLQVREAQVVQETLGRVRVRVVPADSYSEADARAIAAGVRERMGAIEVVVEPVASIARGPNGKFRAVICELDPDTRARASVR
jgi:phenylacetate-CoA ligase